MSTQRLRRRHPRRLLSASALALLLAAVTIITPRLQGADLSDLPRVDPAEVGMSGDRLDRVSETMQRYIDDDLLAGTVALIARHGKIVHLEAQGWRDKEADQLMTADAIFTIMSMTKPIVSVALMTLFEEGRFLLDDPISKWLPDYADLDVVASEPGRSRTEPAARPVTVRHVLTHTSGLSLVPRNGRAHGPRPETLEERIEQSADIPLAFQPGDGWQYGSSTDFVAVLVEKISGKSLDVFLRERVLDPLEMEDTHYYVPESKVNRVAAAYSPTGPGRTIELFRAPAFREAEPYFGGVAGLQSTVHDYFRFHQMMLNGGELDGVRILSPRTINLMVTNHVGDLPIYIRGDGYGFGLGYGILMDPGTANEHLSPGSFMWGGAWGTISWVDPVEDMLGVLMTQVTSYSHLSHRRDFSTLASQAIVKSNRHNPPTVLGYEARR